MIFFEIQPADITALGDGDLRELVGRLCEAELSRQQIPVACASWGGAQEAADGGLDVRVKDAQSIQSAGFVPRENTGFQVKKNSMGKAACGNEMLYEKRDVKTVISELADQKGAYIIVSGKDNCSDKMVAERIKGMQDAIKSLANKNDLLLDFYGCDRLAMWLRQFPAVSLWVRSKLGKPLSGWKQFGRWAATPPDQDDEFLLDDHLCVVSMNSSQKNPMNVADGIKLVRSKLRDQTKKVIRITGLSGVGKTRFAQALFEEGVGQDALSTTDVVYADLGEDLKPSASELISYFIANDFSTCLVLDNCPPDVHRQLQKQIASSQSKVRLLTIEYDISSDKPEETEVIHIEPSSEANVSKLVQKRFPKLGKLNSDEIARFSGGNARVAIALASRVEPDETLTNFSDESLFQRLFSQKKGVSDGLMKDAEILSLVYSFNTSSSEYNDEMGVLAEIGDVSRSSLYSSHSELLRRLLAQKRGNWRAVLPHALANRLALRALQNIAPEKINEELLKSENIRLFKSCAHRIGYLHDSEDARALANTWIMPNAPLFDITHCNADLLAVLEYIAPVFPETVLVVIEKAAATDSKFCSRENANFSFFVKLLRKIAYEDVFFDRAARLILSFARTERENENYDSVADVLKSLFSIHLSGTHATPDRRRAFIKDLLASNEKRDVEIVRKILQSALQTSHWHSSFDFNFGARRRDYGWTPKNKDEFSDWYISLIDMLVALLASPEIVKVSMAKKLLESHFRNLWSFTRGVCVEKLEEVVSAHARGGMWPKIWSSIKKTVNYDGENMPFEVKERLDSLEKLAAPSDFFSKMMSYLFVDIYEHIDYGREGHHEQEREIVDEILSMGELAACELSHLDKLAPILWCKHISSLLHFGKGLARGSVDPVVTFSRLVDLMQLQKLEIVQPILFYGFIEGVHSENPALAQKIQESVLHIPELKSAFIYLLCATSVDDWGVKMLVKLARDSVFEARYFRQIGYGQAHASISDIDLIELMSAIVELDEGLFEVVEILNMRFYSESENYSPSSDLMKFSLQVIYKLISLIGAQGKFYESHHFESIVKKCIPCLMESELINFINFLFNEIESYRVSGHQVESIVFILIKNFPDLILDRVFINSKNSEILANAVFSDRTISGGGCLDTIPADVLLDWCNRNQANVNMLTGVVSCYAALDESHKLYEDAHGVKLSDQIKSLLEISQDRIAIVEILYSKICPDSWSGSCADIMEFRAKAFAELANHPSAEVRNLATSKIPAIERLIHDERARESVRYGEREQRFE